MSKMGIPPRRVPYAPQTIPPKKPAPVPRSSPKIPPKSLPSLADYPRKRTPGLPVGARK